MKKRCLATLISFLLVLGLSIPATAADYICVAQCECQDDTIRRSSACCMGASFLQPAVSGPCPEIIDSCGGDCTVVCQCKPVTSPDQNVICECAGGDPDCPYDVFEYSNDARGGAAEYYAPSRK